MADEPNVALLKAARRVIEVQKTRQDITDADVDAFVKRETNGQFGVADFNKLLASQPSSDISLRNLGRSAMQGATFDFADEALGALPKWLGGGDAAKEEMRLRGDLFNRDHPVADAAASIGGALLPSVASFGTLAPEAEGVAAGKAAVTAGKAIVHGMKVGAATGALGAMGRTDDSDTAGDVLQKTAIGAGMGTTLGAAIPAAVGTAKYLFGKVDLGNGIKVSNVALTQLQKAVAESGYPDPAGGAQLHGEPAIQQFLIDANRAGRGKDVMFADASDRLRSAIDFAANANPNVRDVVDRAARERQGGMVDRLKDTMRKAFGMGPNAELPFVDRRQEALANARSSWASGPSGYGGLEDSFTEVPNTVFPSPALKDAQAALEAGKQRMAQYGALPGSKAHDSVIKPLQDAVDNLTAGSPQAQNFANTILSQPKVKSALEMAKTLGEIGAVPEPRDLASPEKLLHFRSLVSTMEQTAWNTKGRGGLADKLSSALEVIDDHLGQNLPGFADVNAEYRTRMGLERALQAGNNAWTDDPRKIPAALARMTDMEKSQYRYGLASAYTKQLNAAQTNRDIAARLVQPSDQDATRLAAVFGDKPTFDRYLAAAKEEANMAKLRGTAQGSPTQRRAAAASAFSTEPIHTAIAGMSRSAVTGTGIARAMIARHIRESAKAQLNSLVAPQIAAPLLTQGTPAIDAMLKQIVQTVPSGVGAGASTAAPFFAGRVSGMVP